MMAAVKRCAVAACQLVHDSQSARKSTYCCAQIRDAMQLTGPDRTPVAVHTRQQFGRGLCGVTEQRCSRTQFSAEPLQDNSLLLTNLGSNRTRLETS